MTYVKVDIAKPGNVGIGGDKKDKIILIDVDDIATMPARDASGIVITGNIAMNSGAYMVKLYGTQNTIKASSDSEGDPDAKGVTQTVEFEHPGDSQDIREFRANWMNKNVMIIIERCSSSKKNLYGNPCAPLQMVFKGEDDKSLPISRYLSGKSLDRGNGMSNVLSDGADWVETIRNTTERERARARSLLVSLKAFDIIEMLGLSE